MAAAQRWGPSAEPAAWVGFTASTVSPATQDRLGAMACGLTGGRAPQAGQRPPRELGANHLFTGL